MGWKWNQHKDILHRLYVEEKKTLSEIVEYMREHHNFTPSRRSFHGVFCRWGFPSRRNPAYSNQPLINRVRELWEANVGQKDMLSILNAEGYEVGEREIARIRYKHRWMIRSSYGPYETEPPAPAGDDESDHPSDEEEEGSDGENGRNEQDGERREQRQRSHSSGNFNLNGLSDVDAQVHQEAIAMREAQREQRKRMMALTYQERWLAKKRRRHTRAYAGLPPDPPGPPRFPSETTLTEAKEILQLDKETYMALRKKFYDICVNTGVWKKTLAGSEKWEQVKEQLIRESMHLRAVFWDQTDMDKKKLALDVIACDVTKRIRTEATMITVNEAKRILGLNPNESRALRKQMYLLLAQERFTSKLEEGAEFFEALKQRWINGSPLLTAIVQNTEDPEYERKIKAIKMLCRDAVRRYRDDVFRLGKDPLAPPPPKKNKKPKPPPKPKPSPKPKEPRPRQSRGRKKAAAEAQASNADIGEEPAMVVAPQAPVQVEPVMQELVLQPPPPPAPVEQPAAPVEPVFVEDTPAPPPIPPRIDTDPPGLIPGLKLPPAVKRTRGRPLGSGKKATEAQVQKAQQALPHVQPRLVLADVLQPQQNGQAAQQPQQVGQQQQQQIQQQIQQQQQQMVDTSHLDNDPFLTGDSQFDDHYMQTYDSQSQPSQPQQQQVYHQPPQPQQQSQPHPPQLNTSAAVPAPPPPPPSGGPPVAVYIRLHPASLALMPPGQPQQWIVPLMNRTMAEVREGAVHKCPPGAVCVAVQGVIKDGKGGELMVPVTDDGELDVYLEHVAGTGAAVLVVQVTGSW